MNTKQPTVVLASALAFTMTRSWPYLLSRLVRLGCDVVVAVPPGRGYAELAELGCTVEPVPFTRTTVTPVQDVTALRRLLQIVDEHEADLLHAFQAKPTVVSSLVRRRRSNLKLVHTVTGLGRLAAGNARAAALRRVLWLAHARADTVVFQNQSDRDTFVLSARRAQTRTRVILGSGIDLDEFAATAGRTGAGGDLRVLMMSRMIEEKGVREFVDAARILQARDAPVRLRLAGEADPAYRDVLDEATLRRAVADGLFEYLGHVTDVQSLLHETDVTVLPSYYGEGIPRILLESQAAGVPVITTDVPGCRDAVDPERTGLLVPPRDAHALADGIERLARDRTLHGDLAARARGFVTSRFDVRRVADEYLSCYAELGLPVAPG